MRASCSAALVAPPASACETRSEAATRSNEADCEESPRSTLGGAALAAMSPSSSVGSGTACRTALGASALSFISATTPECSCFERSDHTPRASSSGTRKLASTRGSTLCTSDARSGCASHEANAPTRTSCVASRARPRPSPLEMRNSASREAAGRTELNKIESGTHSRCGPSGLAAALVAWRTASTIRALSLRARPAFA